VSEKRQIEDKKTLSTFSGVFVPSILTVLGVIMYLRLGWVVGTVGLVNTLGIIGLSVLITFITGLSISSIATNMEVKTGGAYYMISRSLGPSVGGAIGVPLYFSQMLSVPLYIIGFVESLRLFVPDIPFQTYAITTLVIVIILSFIGAKFILKIQIFILFAVLLSFISFFMGAIHITASGIEPVLWQTIGANMSFWKVFAIFFPAVTGILAGVSMSGELKNPKRSLPIGTLSAIGAGAIIYFFIAIMLAFSANSKDLVTDMLIMVSLAKWPALIIGGIWGAIISSAFGSILGAPRTMQALARDKVLPHIFGRGVGKRDEPLVALFITGILSIFAIIFGELNTIAPIVTMFFLATYGILNLDAGLETLIKNPQYRPKFKTPWYISIIGAIACFLVMFLINLIFSLLAVTTIFIIFYFLESRKLKQNWGDIRKGFWNSRVNANLVKLGEIKDDPKNWRPNILVFSKNPTAQKDLIKVAHWFGKNTGLVMVSKLIIGKLEKNIRESLHSSKEMESFINEEGLQVFTFINVIDNLEKDTAIIAQSVGIGAIKPNTVLLAWEELTKFGDQKSFIATIRNQFFIGKNVLIMSTHPVEVFKDDSSRKIDVWWGGEDRNIELTLLLVHLLKLNRDWKDAKVFIKTIITEKKEYAKKEEFFQEYLSNTRIDAEVEIIKKEKEESIADVIGKNSRDSDLTFIGLNYPEKGKERMYYKQLSSFSSVSPVTLFVRNSKRSEGGDL